MLHRSLAESAGHFWQPAKFENMTNPDFKYLKHLQNPGHLLITADSICGKEEHVGITKRMFIVIKEFEKFMCHEITYQYYTKLMIQSFISCVVKWLNEFPTRGGT